ncbi:MAG: Rpp14/Pop5 family protein [Candidatus Micrarchaeota archaeon]|nr:Rpp14/Pop5 family protein [Candidatus Micrarchaeota archaeon]MDE1804694.1 Rpp14/Pop5 family protein [Candidatus Micrarchaeota archaeon]MDE1846802.1 Rpp14/Pop5 family protein [Candidatus Micrarchaeota archaeon]
MILKRKSRYLLVEASRDVDMQDKQAWGSLRSEMLAFLGESRYVSANPFLMSQLDPRRFIIRVGRGSEREMVLALAFIKSMGGKETGFYTLKISGTIKSLKTKNTG